MATPLASAFIRIRPDTSGFQREAEQALDRSGRQAGTAFSDSFSESARRSGAGEDVGRDTGRRFGSAFADSLRVAAGVTIAKIGELAADKLSEGFNQALDLSAARGMFQAQLGLTAQESARVGGVAGKLFSQAYGDSMEEVNGAVTSVIRNISGMRSAGSDALESMTSRAITTGKILDEDVGAVTRAVSQLLRTGLAPNAQAAFDLINKGAQSGLNVAGDLLDTVSEYSTQFREVGLTGPRAFGLMQQALQAGARDADTAADAIKEFAIRSKTASDPNTVLGFKALGLSVKETTRVFALGGPAADRMFGVVINRLKGIQDPVKRNAAATALFGTKAEDLGKALYAFNPSTAEQSLGKLAGTTDRASQAMGDTAQAKFETFKRTLQTSVVNVIVTEVIPAVNRLSGRLNDLGVSGKDIVSVAGPLVGIGIAAKVGSAAVGTLKTGISGIKAVAGGVSNTAQAAGRLAQGFRSAQAAESAFSGRAGTFGGALRKAYDVAANGARTFATASMNAARAAGTAALAVGRAAVAHARAGAAALLNASRTLIAAAAQRVAAVATRAWAIVQAAMNVVLSANPIGLVVLAIGALVTAVVLAYRHSQTFRNIVDAAFRGIAAAGKFMWDFALKPVFNGIKFFIMNILVPYYKTLWNTAKLAFGGIATVAKAVWDGVLKPVFDKIKSAVSAVGHAFSVGASAIGTAWAKIKDYTKAPVNFVINTVFNKGIVGLWNKVMGWLHLPASLQLGTIPALESGGMVPASRAGKRDRPTAIVGEGDPNHPEYVIPTDPKYRGRARALWAAAGSKMQLMESGGILGEIKGLAGKVKSIAGTTMDLLTNPGKAWDKLVSKLPSWNGLKTSPFGSGIAAIPDLILKHARDYAVKFFKAFSDGYGGGGNSDVVKAALKYIGVGDDRGVNNDNPFTRYYGWPPGTPWCALFASKAIEDAHATKRYPGAPTASVAAFNAAMKHVPVGSGRPGDLATYGSNDHVNIIIKKAAGGYDTVGGNQGPKVNRYVRGNQATVLRPLATGGVLTARLASEVFGQRNLDRADGTDKALHALRHRKYRIGLGKDVSSINFGFGKEKTSESVTPEYDPVAYAIQLAKAFKSSSTANSYWNLAGLGQGGKYMLPDDYRYTPYAPPSTSKPRKTVRRVKPYKSKHEQHMEHLAHLKRGKRTAKPRFDNGGYGIGWPFHAKKPEAVFTSPQWQAIHALVKRGSAPNVTVHVTGVPGIPTEKQITNAIDRSVTLYGGKW